MARGSSQQLLVTVSGDTSQLNRALRDAGAKVQVFSDKAVRDTKKFGDQTTGIHARVRKSFGGMATSALKAGAAFAGAYASIEGVKKAVDATETLAHATIQLHNNLGLSVKSASEFAAVASTRGIDTKPLQQSFGTLAKSIEASHVSTSKQAASFKALGISQKVLTSGNFQQQLGAVADTLGKMEGGTKRTALGMQLFGRGWQTVLPMLRQGSKGLREQLTLADKYGATFGGKTAESMEEFIVKQREAKLAMLGLQVTIGTQVAPVLTTLITKVTGFVKQMRDGTGAGGRFAKTMSGVATALAPVIAALGKVLGFLGRHPKLIAAAIGAWVAYKAAVKAATVVTGISNLIGTVGKIGPAVRVAAAVSRTAFSSMLGPIGAVVAALAAAQPLINKITGGGLTDAPVVDTNSGHRTYEAQLTAAQAQKAWDKKHGIPYLGPSASDIAKSHGRSVFGSAALPAPSDAGTTALRSVMASAASAPMASAASSGYSRQSFAETVLQRLGIRPTRANVKAFIGWENAEGGNWNNSASFNPLNTTMGAPGAHSINSAGVKAYTSWSQGISETVKTLRLGAYGGIRRALRSGTPGYIAGAIGASPWGTNAALARSAIGGAHVGTVHAGGAGQFNPAWAVSHIGHFPESGGKNRGHELDQLEGQFGMSAAAWCAMFATMAAIKGGASPSIKTASVASINQWASQGSHGFEKGFKAHPQAGDLITFGNDHVAIVTSVNVKAGTVSALSGNSNIADGSVHRVSYGIDSGRFARPKYNGRAALRGSGSSGTGYHAAAPSPFDKASAVLTTIGLRASAGQISGLTADHQTISTINQALHGRFGKVSGDHRLELIGTRRTTRADLASRVRTGKSSRLVGNIRRYFAIINKWVKAGRYSAAAGRDMKITALKGALAGAEGPLTSEDRSWVKGLLDKIQGEVSDAATQLEQNTENFVGTAFDDAALTMAQVGSPTDSSDDLAVLQGRLGIATGKYAAAVSAGDRAGIVTWGGIIQSIQGSIDSLGSGSADTSAADLAQALKDLKASIDAQNQYAAQVTSVSLGQAWKALADVVSGQITGVGYQGRAAMAGSGAIARY